MKNQTYRMTMLLDFYGEILTQRQREFFDLYYNEDLSLAEIAENYGISRQGVRDAIVRAETAMEELEDKTGLLKRFMRLREKIDAIEAAAAEIQKLNSQYRNKDMPTDVLSFPLGEGGVYDHNQDTGAALLGDIVISMERAMEQAELYGQPLQREGAFLTVHSMLHLLGYDHEVGGLEAVKMREKEEAVLIQLGLPRTVSYTADQL